MQTAKREKRFRTYEVAGVYVRASSARSARSQARRRLKEMGRDVPEAITAKIYDPAADPAMAGFIRKAA